MRRVNNWIDYLKITDAELGESNPKGKDISTTYIYQLESRVEELEAEVKEANDNATWWHNRYNAAERKIERLENDYYFALDKLVGGAKMIKRQQKCLMDEYLVLKDKREKRINDHIKKLEGKDAA